ncbi:MAG: hypothetical protein ACK4M7_01345, partial [Burkholderiales bacterium]
MIPSNNFLGRLKAIKEFHKANPKPLSPAAAASSQTAAESMIDGKIQQLVTIVIPDNIDQLDLTNLPLDSKLLSGADKAAVEKFISDTSQELKKT